MITFDENGFSKLEGMVVAYACYENNRELMGSVTVSVQPGFGLPANTYLDIPPPSKAGMTIVRDNDTWVYVNDFRGQNAYAKKDGAPILIEALGEPDESYTLIAPETPFDEWDGQGWVKNIEKEKNHAILIAEGNKRELSEIAEKEISLLNRAVRLGIATDDEKKMLNEWELYSVYLSRVDIKEAPYIKFPKAPERNK